MKTKSFVCLILAALMVLTLAVPAGAVEGPEITVQPVNAVGEIGDAVSFTVEATGNGLSYQWQYSSDAGKTWKNSGLPGNDTATLSTQLTEARTIFRFRCLVTDSGSNTIISNTVRMYKAAALEITAQPVNYEGREGDPVSFTVAAAGAGLSYQWQYSSDAGKTWKASGLPGNKTAVLSTTFTAARRIYRFRCVVTDAAGAEVISNTVRILPAADISITSQPVDYEGRIGDPVTFTVAAVGDGLTYQWQYSKDDGETWGASGLPGNKTAELSTEFTAARLVYMFRCLITDGNGGSVTTNAVRMISAAPETELAITSQPVDYEGRIGDPVTFTVVAAGDGLAYQWQYSKDGGETWGASGLPGNKTATLSTEFTAARLAYIFRCVVSDAVGNTLASDAVRMVSAAPEVELAITSQPVDCEGSIGDPVTFTVAAVGDGLTYQWQYSKDDGETWGASGLPGNKTATLSTTFTEARLVYIFRCVVSDAVGNTLASDAVRMVAHEHSYGEWIEDETGFIGTCSCGDTVHSVSADVEYTAQAAGAFLIAPKSAVTVDSSLAERYGLADSVAAGESVSALDVLIQAHIDIFGEDFTPETAEEYFGMSSVGYMNRIFGIETYNIGFAVNELSPIYGEKDDYGYYSGYTISEAAVETGDSLMFMVYQDSYAMDKYTFFADENGVGRSFTAEAGTELELTVSGYWIGWYGTMSADLEEALNWCDAIEGAQIALVDAQSGEITDIADAITDEDGAVTLCFDEPGEYLITAYVTAEQIADYENPLIMTLATITVTDHVWGEWTADETGYVRSCACGASEHSVSADVDYTAQAAGAFLTAPKSAVTVDSSLAERCGFIDSVAASESVSALDVLMQAHIDIFGEDFTIGTADDYFAMGPTGYMSKIFGIETYNIGFAVNELSPIYGEKDDYGYYTGYTISEAAVETGDSLMFMVYQDSYAMDKYTFFADANGIGRSFTVEAGTELELTVSGYWIGWYGTMSADLEEALNWCEAIEGAQIALVDAQSGEITDIADAITDEDGAVTLSFDEPGEYLITAYVTAEQIADYENPLIMTLAEITVTAAANS